MVQVPITSRNTVDRQPLHSGGLRYAAPRNLVGPAVEQFGNALGQAAEDIDHIEAAKDQAYAVDGDNAAAVTASDITSKFRSLQGDAPDRELPDSLKQFDDLQGKLLEGARSERARAILKRNLSVRRANLQSTLTAHADGEMLKFRDTGLASARDIARDDAVASVGTEHFGVAMGTGLTRIAERAKLLGLPPEAVTLEESKFKDDVHAGVLDTMFAVPNPDVDAIGGYLQRFGGDMTPALKNKVLGRLQGPLQQRETNEGASLVLGFVRPASPGEKPTATPAAAAKPIAVDMLREFESFRTGTYWDVDHHRVGYGSDTITTASGQVRSVKAGDTVTRADADRDLERRTGALERTAAAKAGAGWNELPAGARAAVVSVAYNYGEAHDRLKPLWAAAAKGDAGAVADVIESFAGDNGGTNRSRRLQEAETARTGGGYESAPREWDRAAIYENLATVAGREGWNPEKTERVRGELDKRIARDEGLLKDKQADADEAAASIVAKKGDGFRVHMIPSEVWSTLTPVQQRQYQDIEEKLTAPKPPAANGSEALALSVMRIQDPERFAGLNLAKYQAHLTPAEYEQFAKDQATISKGGGAAVVDRSKIDGTISRMKNWGGVDLSKNDVEALRVRRYMETQADELISKGKPVTQADYDRWFGEATQQVTVQNSVLGFNTSQERRRSSEYLSPNFRAVIRREFRQVHRREPDEEEIQFWWKQMQEGAE